MKLYVLDNGSLYCPKDAILNVNDLDLQQALAAEKLIKLPIFTVLIDHPDGMVLFDAACHNEARANTAFLNALRLEEDQKLLNRLDRIGVAPEAIRYVVLSHMHTDHTGYIDRFPNAEIIATEIEFSKIVRAASLGNDLYASDVSVWMDKGLKWKLIPEAIDELELCDGIRIFNFRKGHSYGMLGMLVSLPTSGNILLVSDAVHTKENLGPPRILPAILVDAQGTLETMERIDSISRDFNACIWCGHDLEQFEALIKSTEGYYD